MWKNKYSIDVIYLNNNIIMTTLTVTKTNYAQLIDQINDMLFREKKIVVNIDTFDRIQKLYDNAKDEHKK